MDNLFEQMTNITKAHAYDIIAKQRDELMEQNKALKSAIRNAVEEVMNMNPEEVVNEPSKTIIKITNHLTETFKLRHL